MSEQFTRDEKWQIYWSLRDRIKELFAGDWDALQSMIDEDLRSAVAAYNKLGKELMP